MGIHSLLKESRPNRSVPKGGLRGRPRRLKAVCCLV